MSPQEFFGVVSNVPPYRGTWERPAGGGTVTVDASSGVVLPLREVEALLAERLHGNGRD